MLSLLYDLTKKQLSRKSIIRLLEQQSNKIITQPLRTLSQQWRPPDYGAHGTIASDVIRRVSPRLKMFLWKFCKLFEFNYIVINVNVDYVCINIAQIIFTNLAPILSKQGAL